MTDRELLEAAARAAGYKTKPHPNGRVCRNLLFIVDGRNWNPLESDGDALRLAVRLGFDIAIESGKAQAAWLNADSSFIEWCEEYLDPDPYAATRRAIVRAAAEIGKV